MTEPEVNAFPTHLAVRKKVSTSTQTQALSALLFLFATYGLGKRSPTTLGTRPE